MDENEENKMSTDDVEDTIKTSPVDLDTIYMEELGQFGPYQLRTQFLLAVAVIFIAWASSEYIFTTARIRTRCLIPECENAQAYPEFFPEWLSNAVPSSGDRFDNCQRFANISATTAGVNTEVCPAELFNQEIMVPCEQYVYETTHTVVYQFGLACDEWRRSLIGSLRMAGMFVAMPLIGFISDRWGRHTALAFATVNSACLGSLRYFANTYLGFVISQIFEAVFGAGYSCAYILIMESVGPKYRVAAGAALTTCFATGQVLLGLIAWSVPNWKHIVLIVYLPQFIGLSFFWIIPESVRWYLSRNMYEEASASLKNIARVNGKELSEQSLEALRENAEEEKRKLELTKKERKNEPWLVVLVFQHKPILLRCLVSPVWWIATTFIYYGLTINSVNISGNGYVNFIAVTAIEIPGFWISVVIMNMVGRKPSLIAGFWTCAACQFSYLFMPDDQFGASLAVYLVGKCSIAVVATTLYVYTAELYPTNYRHRLFAFSSMLGRIGSILAPLTPAFGDDLPFILFGSSGLVAGLLVFVTPETRGARFPDTMEQAAPTAKGDNKARE